MKPLGFFLLILLSRSCTALVCSNPRNCILCDQHSGHCIECIPGLFGQNCDRKCRPNCKFDACIQIDEIDVCKEGCKPGYFGRRCSIPCRLPISGCVKCVNGCQDGYCMDNHTCVSGCHDSYYGSKCLSCPHTCKECNHSSGVCNECYSNYGGLNCEVSCKNCLGLCNTEGCFKGCNPGYFGAFCNNVCSTNCLDTCEQGTGNCNDCQDGRYGPFCQSRCSTGCKNKTCTSNGHCLHGCTDGYFGPDCASTCRDACIRYNCKGESKQFCLKICNICGQSCRGKPITCSETCLRMLTSSSCVHTTTQSTQSTTTIEITRITETLQEDADSFVIYVAMGGTGLLVMMVALFIYFSCRFQRIRSATYGSVRNPTIHVTDPVELADQSVPSVVHEYDEVEDCFNTIDLRNPIIAEVFGNARASAGKSTSFPRMVNYTTMKYVSVEGLYLTPKADPEQRPTYRHSW